MKESSDDNTLTAAPISDKLSECCGLKVGVRGAKLSSVIHTAELLRTSETQATVSFNHLFTVNLGEAGTLANPSIKVTDGIAHMTLNYDYADLNPPLNPRDGSVALEKRFKRICKDAYALLAESKRAGTCCETCGVDMGSLFVAVQNPKITYNASDIDVLKGVKDISELREDFGTISLDFSCYKRNPGEMMASLGKRPRTPVIIESDDDDDDEQDGDDQDDDDEDDDEDEDEDNDIGYDKDQKRKMRELEKIDKDIDAVTVMLESIKRPKYQ